jgi:hypothetical protein
MGLSAEDKEDQLRVKAFESAWPELGWIEGRNIHVDYRWGFGDIALMRTRASELVAAVYVVQTKSTQLSALSTVSQTPDLSCCRIRLCWLTEG